MGPKQLHVTREGWLRQLTEMLRPMFQSHGAKLPARIRVSCSWPGGGSARTRVGEAWSPKCSADGTHETFISPAIADVAEVAHILVHELVHHAVGVAAGHRGPFRKLAVALGLTGKMTATVAGPELASKLAELTDTLGPYPHKKLTVAGNVRKQTTRMLKVQCDNCGCVVRMTRKWLEDVGPPTCACGLEMETC